MPTIKFKIIDFTFQVIWKSSIILASSIYLLSSFAPLAEAATDPISATASATATVPSTPSTTSDTTAPTTPILIRPEDDSITSDNRIEFVWDRSTDPNGNTVVYTLYLDGVATYLNISDQGNTSGTGYTSRIDGNQIILSPSTSLSEGSHDWYITAGDPSGNISRSATWDLIIDTTHPPLTLVDLDSYHNPSIIVGSNFDIVGPKDIIFTVSSDPYTRIQITFTLLGSAPTYLTMTTDYVGLVTGYKYLVPGIYTIGILAIDQAGNSTFLSDFTINISQAAISIVLPAVPGSTPVEVINIPYSPPSLTSLPATITNIETRSYLPNILVGLLAASIILLLIYIWRKYFNLLLLDNQSKPIEHATIYHSIPGRKTNIMYLLPGQKGRVYIPHLKRLSTFTVRVEDSTSCTTYVFSISATQRLYTITLG